MGRSQLFLLAALLLVALARPAAAADSVEVRGAEHKGFARIAVQWPQPVSFDAKVDGETLTIHFARAFNAPLAPLRDLLDDYVASVSQSSDGTAIIAKLKKPVTIKTMTVEKTIAAIDLVARRQEAPTAKHDSADKEPASPPAHDKPVAAQNSASAAAAPRSSGAPVNLISPFTSTTAGTVAAPDVAPAAEKAPAPPSAAKGESEKVEVRGAVHREGFARIAIEWPRPITFDAKLDGENLTIHFPRPFTARLEPLAHTLDGYVARIGQSADGTSILVTLKKPVELRTATVDGKIASIDLIGRAAADKTAAMPAAGKKDEPKSATAKTDPAPVAVAPKNATPAASEANSALPPAGRAVAAGGTMSPVLTFDNDRAALRFDWSGPTGAAIYRRGAATWIVFNTPVTLDLAMLRQRGQTLLRAADQIHVNGATALRLITVDGINASARRAGNAWIVDLKHQDPTTDTPIVVEARPSGPTPAVELHVHDADAPLQLRDPLLRDRLMIVPVGEVGRGIDATRDFVDFRLLPSIQGVVIRPNADDLAVESSPDEIQITRRAGLVLSDVRDRLLSRSVPTRHRIFDFADWLGPPQQSFIDRRSFLERAIVAVPPGARTRPRIDLARFYFANLFAPEASSVLAQIARDDPQAAADPSLRALKGAACLLEDDLDCAALELGQSNLDSEPEAGLWRGSLAAKKGDWNTAAREFVKGTSLLSTYPKILRNRFALEAARAMLRSDRPSEAQPLLDIVMKDKPDIGDRAMGLYLQGRVEQQMGQIQQALDHWAQVVAMDDRKARARALYARIMELYETKKASGVDTIKALDAMRFAWRGDNFEFTLLRRLGELKLAEHDPEGGLSALQLAISYFPDNPQVKDVKEEAVDHFVDSFTGKDAEDMPPLKALALYDDFHDLDPSGERHDAIVKNLVDRLVSVDLLDRAASLLDDEVKNHLSGAEKARAATQLALLRLMNQQPQAALTALDIDVAAGATPDLNRQRQQLRARALLDLNRAPEAIAILGNDNSRDAYRLRADIYWREHDWKNAAQAFATLAGSPPTQGPLDPATAQLVLNWAAALTLDGDQQALAKLRQDFGAAMVGTQAADAFKLIAGDGNDLGGGTPGDVAARVAEIGTLQNFMSAYKDRLATAKLSAIN